MPQAQDDLLALAQDPSTPLTTLQALAQNYPGLRPTVAANPSTYPALLEWLGALGDPAVDAALAARASGTDGAAAGALPPVVTPVRQPIQQTGQVDSQHAVTTASQDAVPQDTLTTPALPAAVAPGSTTALPATAAPVAAASGTAAAAAASAPQGLFGVGEEVTGEPAATAPRRGGALPWIALVAALAALAAVLALVLGGGGSPEDRAATAPATEAAPATQVSEEAPDEEATTPAPQATAAHTPAPTPSATATRRAPAPAGAVTMPAFTSPSGNITCVLEDHAATCTINEHSAYSTPACAANQPYVATVGTSGPATGTCAQGYAAGGATLAYDQTAVNGDVACTATLDDVHCWSQVSGEGFSLSRAAVDPYRAG